MKHISFIMMFLMSGLANAFDCSLQVSDNLDSGAIVAKCAPSTDYTKSVLRLEKGDKIKYVTNYEGFMKSEICEADARSLNEAIELLDAEQTDKAIIAKCSTNANSSKSALRLERAGQTRYALSFDMTEDYLCEDAAKAINEAVIEFQ